MRTHLISIWPGNSEGLYELGEIDVGENLDPRYDYCIELTSEQLYELLELREAKERYYKLLREYKRLEVEPLY